MLTNTTGMGERWTVNQAVNWIAFRVAPQDAPATIWPPAIGPFSSVNVMGALAARAACVPRSWPGPGGIQPDCLRFEDFEIAPAYYLRTLVKRWMRRLGLTASELLVRWDADRERCHETAALVAEQQRQLNHGLAELVAAAASSGLMMFGRPAADQRFRSRKPREVIPAHFIDEYRSIDAWGNLSSTKVGFEYLFSEEDDGPFYADIAFDSADLVRLWPANGHVDPARPVLLSTSRAKKRALKKTGPKPVQTQKAVSAMLADLKSEKETPRTLSDIDGYALGEKYEVSRNTATGARERALSEFVTSRNSDKL